MKWNVSANQYIFAFVLLTGVVSVAKPMEPSTFLSAGPSEVAAAKCHHSSPPTDLEMEQWLDDFSSKISQRTSIKINGVQFENENPELIRFFDKLTTRKDEDDNTLPSVIPSSCSKVVCAVNEVFGQELGLRLLYMLARYHFNGSDLADPDSIRWTAAQLDEVLWSLSDFPSNVLPMRLPGPLVHAQHDPAFKAEKGHAYVTSDAHIFVYDFWDTQRPLDQVYEVSHEVGHRLDNQYLDGISFEKVWKNFSWNKDGIKNPSTLVSKYAENNEVEDFAESVTAFHYNPSRFENSKPKYDFLKSVIFGGLDFSTGEACDPRNSDTGRLRTDVERELQFHLQNGELPAEWVVSAQKYCGEEIAWALGHDRFRGEFPEDVSLCLSRGLVAAGLAAHLSAEPNLEIRKSLIRIAPQADFPHLVQDPSFASVENQIRENLRTAYEGAVHFALLSKDSCRKWSENAPDYLEQAKFELNFGNIDNVALFTASHQAEVGHAMAEVCRMGGSVDVSHLRESLNALLGISNTR